jgi:hypothetical protein
MLNKSVDAKMNETLEWYMSQNGVEDGNITPAQELEWDRLVLDIANLMEEITQQNKHQTQVIELPMPYVLTMLDALHVIKEHKLYGLMGDYEEVKWQIDTVISEFLDPIANSENTDDIEIVFYD